MQLASVLYCTSSPAHTLPTQLRLGAVPGNTTTIKRAVSVKSPCPLWERGVLVVNSLCLLAMRLACLGVDAQLNYILLDYLEKNKNLKEYKIFQEKIKNVSLLQVNNAMKKYFDTQKLILIYAGDFNKK